MLRHANAYATSFNDPDSFINAHTFPNPYTDEHAVAFTDADAESDADTVCARRYQSGLRRGRLHYGKLLGL